MKKFKVLKIGLIALGLLAAAILGVGASISSPTYDRGDMQMKIMESSPQYRDGKFRNQVPWEQPSFGEYAGTMWEFIFGGSDRKPDRPLPRKTVDPAPFNRKGLNMNANS